MSLKIGVIVGSTRPGRVGDKVAAWYLDKVKDTNGVEFEVIDLAELKLPFLDEKNTPSSGKYENEHTKQWAKKIDSLDGFVWITAEYNHSIPGALKNAIDFVFAEWARKPVAIVSYGGMGGARAAEHLRAIAGELQMADIRSQVLIREPWVSVDKEGNISNEYIHGNPKEQMNQLVWWTKALKTAREA